MSKDLKLIIDQLRNNENSTDKELAIFLSSHTSWGGRELLFLITNTRDMLLNLPINASEEEI
jgi:hypothetical protein